MANDLVLNQGETLGDPVAAQPQSQAAPQLNEGETLGDPVQDSAVSRFGAGALAATKAMIPHEAPSATDIALSGLGALPQVVKMGEGAYQQYEQARKEGQPIVSSVASGIGSVAGLDPEDIRQRAARGDVAGVMGEAVPSIALTILGGEHERIGKAFQSDARALKTASATHDAATAMYDQRLKEQELATQQAVTATQRAQDVTNQLKSGNPNVTQAHVDEANTVASQASANARKASQALNDAHESRAQAGVEVDRLARKVQRTSSKVSERQTKDIVGAKEDFQKAIPPAPKGKAAYTDRDYEIGRRYLEEHHQNVEELNSVQGMYDALDQIQGNMEKQVAPFRQEYAKEPIKTNVNMDVRDALAENPRADFVQKGMEALENYNLTDPTIDEAEGIRKQLNSEIRGRLADTGWDIQTALDVDPAFAAKYAALDSLRDGIYNVYEEHNVQGVRELRQDEASIIKLRNAAQRQLTKGEVRLRGSGESGALRKAVGQKAGVLGAGLGAGAGALTGIPGATEAGAMGGELIGKKLGGIIAPGDMTRNKLIERSMKVRGGGVPITEITGRPSPAGQFGPPSAVSPVMQMYVPQREMTPLHTDLATHYNEDVNRSSYIDLENRFKQDLESKRTHGVPLESDEKSLLKQMNQADAADHLAARKQMTEAALTKQALPMLPEDAEPLLRAPASQLAEGMDTQRGIVHDIAHAVVGSERGIDFRDGIRSHFHPENQSAGNVMSAPIDWEPFMDKDGNVDPAKLKTKIADLAATYVAGGVANDLYHDIPFTENHHLGADVRILKSYLKNVGFSEVEASKMISQATDDAAQILSRPGVQEIIERHAAVREPGLDKNYHVSPERMDQILEDIKSHETGKPTGTATAGKRAGEEAGAEAEDESEEGNSEQLRPEGKGPSGGEGGSNEGNDAGKPGEPALGQGTSGLTHQVTEKGGEIRLADKGGMLKYTMKGDQAEVSGVHLEPEFRKKGIGTEMYERAAQEAKARGAKALTSDLSGTTSMDAAKVWERLKEAHPGEIEQIPSKAGSPGYRWNLQSEIKPENPALGVPPERTTGEHDEPIKAGGAIPGGIQKGDPEIGLHDLALFHDPTSGSTLALPTDRISPENVARELAASRVQYARGQEVPKALGKLADTYQATEGRKPVIEKKLQVDPRQEQMADAYATAKHEPNSPEVKKTYDSLKKDIDKQFNMLTRSGIKVDAYDHDPYEGENLGVGNEQSGAEKAYNGLRNDVMNNKHVSVWKGGAPPADHPLSEVDPKTGLTYNEKFRAIHDVFGHVVPNNDFTAHGEESAWGVHNQMFHPDSRPALATETRGQTAYVTKHGEFANQKATILPKEFHVRPEDLGQQESIEDRSMPLWWNDQLDNTVYGGDTRGGRLVKDAAEQGGFTVHPRTGNAPTGGYQIETFPERRAELDHPPTSEDIRGFVAKNRPLFNQHPDLYVGGYDNKASGKYELNVSGNYKNKYAAINAAKKLDQISIWDNAKKEEIPIGGEGKRTEFGDYPQERRLADLGGIRPENPALSPDSISARLKDTYGTTNDPRETGFILSDGSRVPLRGEHNTMLDHLYNKYGDIGMADAERTAFINNENAVRSRFRTGKGGEEVVFSVPKIGVNPAQVDEIRKSVAALGRNGNALIEISEGEGASTKKEFVRPSDVEPMLREIGAHPDQRIAAENPALSPKGSTVPLMENPLKVKGTAEGGKVNTLDVAKALNKYTKSNIGSLALSKADDAEMVGRAKDLAEDEAKYQLNEANSGKAWYTTDIGVHDDVLRNLRPELKDPAKLSLFKMAEAVLSSGQKPYQNMNSAIKAWDVYNETGQFPGTNPDTGKSWGPRNVNSYAMALDSINRLVKEKGEQGASDWLLANHPLKELRQYMQPGQTPVRGRATDEAPGAMILGAKRGPFAQNLHGLESAFTADMWVSRTWNRWMGTIEHDPQIGEITTDSPRNNTERDLMKKSFSETADKLGLSTSALQAVLWYYEQHLYDVHGAAKESWSFADAAKRVQQEHEAEQVKPETEQFGYGANKSKPQADQRAAGWLEMMKQGRE